MAIVYAVKSGNWSDTTVWNTGALPTSADDVRSNTYTVTVDGNYTVVSVSNKSETSPVVTRGGTFSLADGSILNCTHPTTGVLGNVTDTGAVIFTLNAPASATLNANVSGGSIAVNSIWGVNVTGTGLLTVIGNVRGGDGGGNGAFGLRNGGNGTVRITGNVSAGGNSNDHGVINVGAGTIVITGNVTGGNATTCIGAVNNGTGVIEITGTVTGGIGSSSGGVGISNNSSGTVKITGTLQASAAAAAVGSGSVSQITLLTGPMLVSITNAVVAVSASNWRWLAGSSGTYMQIRTQDLTQIRSLYTADYTTQLMMPAINNVRSGVVYGPVNELTGTCSIPPAASTVLGVPVDNTTGTMIVGLADSAQVVWNYTATNLTTEGSIGARLKNVATAQIVAEQISALL